MTTGSTQRASKLAANLKLSERVFASPSDTALLKAIDAGLDAVEAELNRQVSFNDAIADPAARYLFEAGGKRVRPMLTLLTAELGAGATPEVVTAAAAVELTHLASLYHDDVMDESERRRGVAAAQTVWGNSVAILTGDLLFARASELMSSLGERAMRMQSETFMRLVLGQLHETSGPRPESDPVAHYLQVLADKTGSLISAAARAGIVFSEAPAEFEQPVVEFGERVGVAFQLVDDVIDLSPNPNVTGKVPGTDLRAGVVTLPLLKLRALAATDVDAARLSERIDAEVFGTEDPGRGSDVVAELREHPVTAETLLEARRWAHAAADAISVLPDGSVKKALVRFTETVLERTY
ncbi:MAG TPA: polyprenyl synthetase family protein [Microbacteriaceae bacterium]|nr:polyprenyl synthetase family protein [Microbacteriaceae bacterium]